MTCFEVKNAAPWPMDLDATLLAAKCPKMTCIAVVYDQICKRVPCGKSPLVQLLWDVPQSRRRGQHSCCAVQQRPLRVRKATQADVKLLPRYQTCIRLGDKPGPKAELQEAA